MNVRPFLFPAVFLLAVLGCGHAEPFADGQPADNPPFTTTEPRQITFNLGLDIWPTWSPSGDAIWYSVQDSLSHDKDHCLGVIPPDGGSMQLYQCPTARENNVTEVLQQPTILGKTLAFALADLGTYPPEHVQYRFAIWVAGLAKAATPRRVMRFPYVAPSGKLHDGPIDLRWVRENQLAYIGFEAGCCNKDSQRFGEQIVLADISGDTAVRTFLSDTYRANSLGVSSDGLSIYYTFYGDHRVYRRVLATGAVTIVHDFGAGHIVRDPDIQGQQMVATIDGFPGFRDLPPFDSVAIDHGGRLVRVDLTTGTETLIDAGPYFFKRPRFSPQGNRLVAEGYRLIITEILSPDGNTVLRVDTTASRAADLWTFEE